MGGSISRLAQLYPGCSAAWLARLLWEQEAESSNLSIPTILMRAAVACRFLC